MALQDGARKDLRMDLTNFDLNAILRGFQLLVVGGEHVDPTHSLC